LSRANAVCSSRDHSSERPHRESAAQSCPHGHGRSMCRRVESLITTEHFLIRTLKNIEMSPRNLIDTSECLADIRANMDSRDESWAVNRGIERVVRWVRRVER
uniref:PMEI domain-containing protein n=1 Tax=Anisakis simplex TaxID=6269 RepID=A0A0M3JNT9_ANISI